MKTTLRLAAAALLAAALPAVAHHSTAMVDFTKTVTIEGTIKDFQWTNPHTWLTILVNDGGTTVEWTFEGVSTTRLAPAGFKKDTLMPGDPVSVVYNPRRDGKPGGMFFAVTLADGRTLKLDRYQLLQRGGTRIE